LKRRIFLHPGDYFFAETPAEVQTILGSCVAFTMHDPMSKHGAMCHCLLPRRPSEPTTSRRNLDCFRYVDSALEAMLEQFVACDIPADRLQIKVFGGANVLVPKSESTAIGSLNWRRAKQLLSELNLPTSAHDIGGETGRMVIFDTEVGEVRVRRLGGGGFETGRQTAIKEKVLWARSAAS